MQTFFFVPGTRLHKITDIQKAGVDQIIIDLEDAVKVSERTEIVQQLKDNPQLRQFFIRLPLYDADDKLELNFLKELYKAGFTKFVFPKLQNVKDFYKIKTQGFARIQVIVLIESPRMLLEMPQLLIEENPSLYGIGMGSHDFMAEVGGVHHLKNLEYARQQILYLARMGNLIAIDIASMELKDENLFVEEVKDGVDKGYDAKFLIHPWQLKILQSISLYSQEEYEWALKVKTIYDQAGNAGEFNPVILEGQIIERPHLAKAFKILKYYESK